MLAALLDVRRGESRALLLLGAHFFLLLAATTQLSTTAEAIFLITHPYQWVPFTFLAGAAASVGFSLTYGRVTQGRGPGPASRIATFALLAVLAVLFLLIQVWPAVGAFLLLGLSPGFGVVIGMESASLITRTLDSRQARRLYPAISGIGGIGATVGSLLVAGLSPLIGPKPLVWMAGLFLIAALVPVYLARPAAGRRERTSRVRAEPVPWRAMFANRFSVALVILVSLAGVLSTTAKFALSAAVKEGLPPEEIPTYLGRLYAALNAVSILFGVLITRRIIQRFGLGIALLVYPFLLCLVGIGGLAVPGVAMASAALFSERLFRQNLQRPLVNIATMPLPAGLAARTNLAIRGTVENPAIVVTSLLLIGFGAVLPWHAVFGILLLAGALGVFAASRVRREYLVELVAALRSRRLRTDRNGEAPPVLDAAVRGLLDDQLRSENPERVALALQMLRSHANVRTLESIRAGWPRWPVSVRVAALETLRASSFAGVEAFADGLSDEEPEPVQVARLALRAWKPPKARLEAWMTASSPRVAAAAAKRLLGDAEDAEATRNVEERVEAWLRSDDPTWAGAAISVLAEHPDPEARHRIVEHRERAVDAVLEAAARRPMPELASFCVHHLGEERRASTARDALRAMGTAAIPALRDEARGRAASQAAFSLLLESDEARARDAVVAAALDEDEVRSREASLALWRAGTTLTPSEATPFDESLERAAARCERLFALTGAKEARLASDARIHLDDALAYFFLLLSVVRPRRPYRRMQLSLGSGDERERSFAVEALDESLEAPWRERMLPILDPRRSAGAEEAAAVIGGGVDLAADLGLPPSADASMAVAGRLASAFPFAGMATRELHGVAARTGADDQGPGFAVHASEVVGLHGALLNGDHAPAVPDAVVVPLGAVWPVLERQPYAARAWLRNLAGRWMGEEIPGPDVSVSLFSLASRPSSVDLEIGGDLSLWQRVFYLRMVPLFADLPLARLRAIGGICRLLRVPAGESVVRASRPAGHAYIVCRGHFEAAEESGGETLVLAEGEAIGLRALLSGRSHPAAVTAATDGELLAIDRVDFADLLAVQPGIVRSLSRWLATFGGPPAS